MPTVIPKDVLWVGSAVKHGRRHNFSAADIEKAATLNNAKLAEGWTIPLCWEHQPIGPYKAASLSDDQRAEITKNTFGRIKAFRANGNELDADLEVDDDDDVKRLKSIRNVSPRVVRDWEDADGKIWKGLTIAHVAATARPVQKNQRAFNLSHGLDLSLEDYDMAADTETPEGEETAGGGIKELVAALKECGLNIPEEVEDMPQLIVAVLANKKPEPTEEDMTEVKAPPVSMSLEDMSPAERKQYERAVTWGRQGIVRDLNTLVSNGQLTPAIAQVKAKLARKIDLSFDDDGEMIPNVLTIQIDAYKVLPKNSVFKAKGTKVDLSNETTEIDPPTEPTEKADESTAARKKRMDDMDRTVRPLGR